MERDTRPPLSFLFRASSKTLKVCNHIFLCPDVFFRSAYSQKVKSFGCARSTSAGSESIESDSYESH